MVYKKKAMIPAKYRNGGWVGMAKKAYKGFKYLKSVLNVEHKTYDRWNHSNITPTSAGIIYNMTNIAQGTDDGQRVGNSIKAKSIYFTALVKNNSAQSTPTGLRFIMFIDKEGNDADVPTVGDVLKSSSVDGMTTLTNNNRFHILKDMRMSLPVVSQGPDRVIKVYKKLHHHIKYRGALDTDTEEGQVYGLFMSDQGANVPTWYISSRFKYIDN